VVDTETISAIGFCIVERKIRALEQFLGLDTMFRSQGNPDAGADAGDLTVEIERLRDGADDPSASAIAPSC